MELTQNQLEYLTDQVERGLMTPGQANIEKVLMVRVKIITTRMPKEVRTSLNDAVKRGELKHMKKNGKKPEVYYHPNFSYLVNGVRNEHEMKILKAISGIV